MSRIMTQDGIAHAGDRVLAVTAHPDDEIAMAGTLALAALAGAQVSLLCFTCGEASRSAELDGLVGAENIGRQRLADARSRELQASAAALGVHRVMIGAEHDGSLAARLAKLTDEVETAMMQSRPTVVVSLDDVLGLYGHPDHVASAAAALAATERARAAGDDIRLYQATLPPSQMMLARRFSPVFRRAIDETADSLPVPTLSVRIVAVARQKLASIEAHATQRKVMRDVQPLFGVIPRGLYFRVFSREYFAERPPAEEA